MATATAPAAQDDTTHKTASTAQTQTATDTAAVNKLALAVAALLVSQPQPECGPLLQLVENVSWRLEAVGRGPAWRMHQGLAAVAEVVGAAVVQLLCKGKEVL